MSYKWLYKVKYSERENYDDIYHSRYNSPSTYRYNFKINSHPSFVVVTREMLRVICDIQKYDKKLSFIQQKLPGIALNDYKRSCLIDEVRQTNALEGVVSTRKEINDILAHRNKSTRFQGIVNKYAMLLAESEIQLSNCIDVRNLYDELVLNEVKADDPRNVPDGVIFRSKSVYVRESNTGKIIHSGISSEATIIEYMTELLSILKKADYNELINIAVIHYMFGYIHPFYDGNGRMGRFISSYLLSRSLEQIVSYRLAYEIKKDVNKYYKMFKLTNDERNKGELTQFVLYFLEMIKSILIELNNKLKDYRETLEGYYQIISKMNYDTTCKAILSLLIQNMLFDNNGLSIKEICELLGKGDTTVRQRIALLKKDDYVAEIKAKPYRYIAKL